MEPLRTLTLAALRRDKGTFVGLAVLLALAAFALTLTLGLFVDLTAREGAAMAEIGAGDVYALDLTTNLDDETLTAIEELPEVGEVRVTPTFSVPVGFEDPEGRTVADALQASEIFEAWGSGLPYRQLDASMGAYEASPEAPAPGEVYIAPALTVLRDVELGDYAVFTIGEEEVRLKVSGFFEDPQMGTPFMEMNHYLVAPETFDELIADVQRLFDQEVPSPGESMFSRPYTCCPLNQVNVYLSPEAREEGMGSQDLARIIGEETAWGASANSLFASRTLEGYALMVVNVITAILGVFACLLFAVALVMCVHSVSVAIQEGYADWGIAKAIGLSPRTLRCTLVLQYAIAAVVGMAVGFGAGALLEPLAWPSFVLLTGVLAQGASFPWVTLLCLAGLLALLLGVVLLKGRKLGAITPLVALRGGQGDVRFSPRAACAFSGRWLEAALAWRALVSQKRRYVGVAVCSLLLCAFIVLVFGIGGALGTEGAVNRAFGFWKSDLSVALEGDQVTFDEVEAAIEEACPIDRVWEEGMTMVNLNGEARTFVGLSDCDVLDDAAVVSGRKPLRANEALVGMNLAADLGLEVGDELVLSDRGGSPRTYLVSGVLSAMLNAGYGTILTGEGLTRLTGSDAINPQGDRQYQLADPAKADEVRALIEERFGDQMSVEDTGIFGSATVMVGLIRSMFVAIGYSMAAFAAVLACVAVALISRRMFVGERHDLGVFRAVGFRVRSLRVAFALRFLLVTLVGSALGTAVTMLGGSWLVGKLFGLFGVGVFSLDLPLWKAVALTAALALVFTVAAYVAARAIRRVNVRELVAE